MQAEVDSRREPGGGEDAPVLDVERVLLDVDRAEPARQLVGREPMGSGAPAVEQARVGERERAGADRCHAGAASGSGAQRVEHGVRRRVEDLDVAGNEDRVGSRDRLQPRDAADRKAGGGGDAPRPRGTGLELVQRPVIRPGEREHLGGNGEVERDDGLEAEQRDPMRS